MMDRQLGRAALRAETLEEIVTELGRARQKFPAFHSSHEGYAVLLEELDELWDEVRANAPRERLRAEAIQVAAMAIRFIQDVCEVD